MKELIVQKELTLIRQMHQRNVCFVIIGTLKILNLNLSQMLALDVVLGVSFWKKKNVAILNVKGIDDRWILRGIDKNKAVSILNNSVLKGKSVIVLKN